MNICKNIGLSLLLVFNVVVLSLAMFTGLSAIKTQQIFRDNQFIETGRFIQAGGFNTYIREYGDTNKPVVVLIHGFGGSSWDYEQFAKQLSRDYYVVSMDQLGYGLSEKSTAFDYQRRSQARIIHEVLLAMDLEPFAIAGHSMGGDVVLQFVDEYPDRVEKLILFAAAGLRQGGGSQGGLPGWLIDLTVRNYWLQRAIFEGAYAVESFRTAEVFDPMFYQNAQIPTEVFLKFTQVTDGGSMGNRLSTIDIDTLIVWGELDTFVSVESAYQFEEGIANSTLVVYPGIGHMPFQEALIESLRDVRAFLSN
jgi:pimeloyl-ACP methyl ester carboxylesterase